MNALLFLIKRTLKNLIKGVFKKPAVLIGYLFVLAFFASIIIVSFAMPSGNVRSASPDLFKGIMFLVFFILYYSNIKIGMEKGSTYFRMADVNFVFTAPIRPNNVLLYGFIKQVGGIFLMLFLAMFQIPNLKNNFVLKSYGVWMLLLAVAVYALSFPLINMLIYSWLSKSKEKRQLLSRIFNVIGLAIAVLTLISLSQTRSIGRSIEAVFNHPIARYFPVIGWTASIASAAVAGFTVESWVGLIGMLIFIAGISIALYRMELDYYEDVLEGTEYVEAVLKAKREGNTLTFKVKIKDRVNQKLWGNRALAIFSKQLLEIRRLAHFLFIDTASLFIMISGVVFKFLMPEEAAEQSLLLVLSFSVYMLLIFQMQGRLNHEMEKPYIFLIPDSPQKKLFYVTAAEHVKNLMDGTILYIIAGILFRAEVPVIIACILAYLAFGAVFVYTDVLSRRLFGWVHSRGLLIFIKIIAAFLIQIPGIIAAIIVGITTKSELLTICAMGGWSLVLAITLFVFSSGILNNIESAG